MRNRCFLHHCLKNILLLFLLYITTESCCAQQSREWESLLNQFNELEDFEGVNWENYFDFLSDLEQNPFNINTATREDLEQLPFLTTKDVEDISEYIYKYGAMKSLGELAMIRNLDYYKRQLLFYFTYAGNTKERTYPTLKNILKYGQHDIIGTMKVPLYNRKGDENGYMGYKYKHSLKYDFTYGDYVRVGLVGTQDAGEPFFAGRNKMGYDFYSFYFVLKKLRRVKTLAVGRYRVNFGLGLVINNNFGFGKLSAISSLGRNVSTIRAHSSRSDANYLQGAATTINVAKGLDLSVFASYRKFDATLNKGDSTIATILNSGYHRTKTEMKKKNNSSHTLIGGNVSYRFGGFNVGATAVYTSLDKELIPKTEAVYRRHYANGKTFYNISANYGYTGHRLSFNGETATGDCHAIATINTLSYSISDNTDVLALQRFYSYKYYSLFSQSFSEGGTVQDESGIYFGVTWRPKPTLKVMAYTDFAYFAWPKYQASNSSHASDNLLQITYSHKKLTLSARYRLKIREKDNEEKNNLINKTEHKGRFCATYDNGLLMAKAQADIAYTSYKETSFGWMINQNASLNIGKHINLFATVGYFNTDDYDSRIYIYERSMYQSFSFPSFYGNGIHYALLANYALKRKFTATIKIGTTKYFDRDKIGNSYQQINGSSATDLEFQVRLRL